jgi:hypothetical protein
MSRNNPVLSRLASSLKVCSCVIHLHIRNAGIGNDEERTNKQPLPPWVIPRSPPTHTCLDSHRGQLVGRHGLFRCRPLRIHFTPATCVCYCTPPTRPGPTTTPSQPLLGSPFLLPSSPIVDCHMPVGNESGGLNPTPALQVTTCCLPASHSTALSVVVVHLRPRCLFPYQETVTMRQACQAALDV